MKQLMALLSFQCIQSPLMLRLFLVWDVVEGEFARNFYLNIYKIKKLTQVKITDLLVSLANPAVSKGYWLKLSVSPRWLVMKVSDVLLFEVQEYARKCSGFVCKIGNWWSFTQKPRESLTYYMSLHLKA